VIEAAYCASGTSARVNQETLARMYNRNRHRLLGPRHEEYLRSFLNQEQDSDN
jgi:hypothetical protein